VHLLIRCSEFGSNDKLARRPATTEELAIDPDDKIKVIAETRGEGGFTVEPPSHGKVHPSGRPYVLERGNLASIRSITPEQRDQFLSLIRTFDELPEQEPRTPPVPSVNGQHPVGVTLGRATDFADGPNVIADFNARTTWEELLPQAGWTLVRTGGGVGYWKRPGKSERGHSATTNVRGSDRFCVFSTSTKFKVTDPGGGLKAGHDRFGFYAAEYHGSDQKGAARELFAQGYGARDRRNGHTTSSAGTAGGEAAGGTPQVPQPPQPAPWGDPARVLGLPAAPVLDLAHFPPEIASIALDAAERLQAPPDYLAWGQTVTVAGLIGRRAGIRPRQYDDWTERGCLWVVLIGDPSWMKSPAIEEVRRSLRRQEAVDRAAYE